MPGGLLVGIGDPDEIRLGKKPPNDLQPCRENIVGETHGNCDGRETGVRRDKLAVVPGRAIVIADFPRGIAPGRIHDGIQFVLCHRLQYGITESDIARFVIKILANWLICHRGT